MKIKGKEDRQYKFPRVPKGVWQAGCKPFWQRSRYAANSLTPYFKPGD